MIRLERKVYEEFYTKEECIDLHRHVSLGVVTNLKPRPKYELNTLLELLEQAFDDTSTTKAVIVDIMREFLVNFDHVEMGKTLDSKM